jgi:hypothetical protein
MAVWWLFLPLLILLSSFQSLELLLGLCVSDPVEGGQSVIYELGKCITKVLQCEAPFPALPPPSRSGASVVSAPEAESKSDSQTSEAKTDAKLESKADAKVDVEAEAAKVVTFQASAVCALVGILYTIQSAKTHRKRFSKMMLDCGVIPVLLNTLEWCCEVCTVKL